MGLTKRELAVVADTHQGRYTVWIKQADDGFWRVQIHLNASRTLYGLDQAGRRRLLARSDSSERQRSDL